MITSIGLVDFKNFERETLHIGPLTIIVGANASGKSNIRDAFRFLHGVGRGYTLAEIIGGKHGMGGQREWAAIRGAPKEISRLQQDSGYFGFLLEVGIKRGKETISYSIGVESDTPDFRGFRLFQESLHEGNSTIYDSHPEDPDPVLSQDDPAHLLLRMGKVGGQRKYGNRLGRKTRGSSEPTGLDPDRGAQRGQSVAQGRREIRDGCSGKYAVPGFESRSDAAACFPRTNCPGRWRREFADRTPGRFAKIPGAGPAWFNGRASSLRWT